MKVLLINTRDIVGGAARASYRLHKGLKKLGVDSKILSVEKYSSDPDVLGPESVISKKINKIYTNTDKYLLNGLYPKKTSKEYFSTDYTFYPLLNKINKINPDIVHFHWVTDGMISLKVLKKIKQPILWSLHDLWPISGGCHYDIDCGKYKMGCGKCPQLNSKNQRDLSRKQINRKKEAYSNTPNIQFVGLSTWITKCIKESYATNDNTSIINLPNGIDISEFQPIPKNIARSELNLPLDKKLILFGAAANTDYKIKGFKFLLKAFEEIDREDLGLILFGTENPKDLPSCITPYFQGRVTDNSHLKLIYSSADLLVLPSIQENLSNVVMESLSCGCPVVAFNIGGNKDMIDHKSNGYLAKPFNTTDLAKGMNWCLNNSDVKGLRKSAREKIVNEFELVSVSQKYHKLYKSLMVGNKQLIS